MLLMCLLVLFVLIFWVFFLIFWIVRDGFFLLVISVFVCIGVWWMFGGVVGIGVVFWSIGYGGCGKS